MSASRRGATLGVMPSATSLSEHDLAAFLRDHELAAELVHPGVPTPTVPDAARALGVRPDAIVKSLVFEADLPDTGRQPVLVIAAGEARVRMRALARALGIDRRAVRLASPERTRAITGYAVGSMPPFGHRAPLPTLVDSLSVPESGVVYGGGGEHDVLLRVPVDALLSVTRARRLPLTDDPPPDQGGGVKEMTS